MTRDLTDDEWLTIRTALLTASAAADATRCEYKPGTQEYVKLDKFRWDALKLAEKLQ